MAPYSRLLGRGGIIGLMPGLYKTGATIPGPGDAFPEGSDFRNLVTLAVLYLVEAAHDG